MKLMIDDSENESRLLQMGCYGIGVSRIIAAAIEQNHDDNGIIWPDSISPFDAVIVEIDGHKNESIKEFSSKIYSMLVEKGKDIIHDDRTAKLGNKLYDWELIGVPNFIIIGKSELETKKVTYKKRGSSVKESINTDELLGKF